MIKILKTAAAAAFAAVLLCGCDSVRQPAETTQPVSAVTELVLSQIDTPLAELDTQYPGLQRLDLSGYSDYAAIEGYIAAHPQVQVTYGVSLGGKEFSPDEEALILYPGDYEYLPLIGNLPYLHKLKSIQLESCTLMPETVAGIRAAFPNLDVRCSVEFCGVQYDDNAAIMDLSQTDPEEAIAQAAHLALLPKLQIINLMEEGGGSSFTLAQAAQLRTAVTNPDVLIQYTFDLFGKVVSTGDEEVVFVNQNIAAVDGALDTIRTALTLMTGCQRFVLDNCKFTNEELAVLREEFRGRTKIVWRIWFAQGGCLTDNPIIRYVYGLYDSNSENLIYCEDAEFIDIGHNEFLKNCDFVSGMPNLKAIILSGSMISDLTPFENCTSLEFLEIAYCGYVEDITPLSHCRNLKRLNIAYTKVEDLSPLDDLNLEVMVDARCKTSQEERERFDLVHPDCIVQHTGDAKDDQPYGYPWRYEKNGDANEYYALLKEKFNYPNAITTLY